MALSYVSVGTWWPRVIFFLFEVVSNITLVPDATARRYTPSSLPLTLAAVGFPKGSEVT